MKTRTIQNLPELQLKNDEELFALIKEDVKAAYFEIVERWATKLYFIAYKRIQDDSIAMILVKQVFAELWESREKLRVARISYYLKGSLKHKLYNLYEKNGLPKTFPEPLNHFAMATLNVDSALDIKELKRLIERWLLTQPPERVQIFNLKYKSQLTSMEISEKLNILVKTVNEQIASSRISLNDYVKRFIAKNLN